MFCPQCGGRMADTAVFCENCGAKLRQPSLPEGIYTDANGDYFWYYEINLWKNGAMLASILKTSMIFPPLFALLFFFVDLQNGFSTAALHALIALPVSAAALLLLMLIGYVLSALINGGRYCAVFSMGKNEIVHAMSRSQRSRARLTGLVSLLISGEASTFAALSLSESFHTVYEDVRVLKRQPKNDLIRLNGRFIKNQIYAAPHQYAFVAEELTRRCSRARIL